MNYYPMAEQHMRNPPMPPQSPLPPYHPFSQMMTEMREYVDARMGQPGEQQPIAQPASQFSPLIQASVAWVDSLAEAEAYPIEPGQAIILIQKDKNAIYEKIHDKGSWKPPELREYHHKEDEPFVMPEIPLDTGVEDMRRDILEIKDRLEVLINAGNNRADTETGSTTTRAVSKNSKSVKSSKQHSDTASAESTGSDGS